MAQDLTVNIKTTSDVPQAMGKASSAASNFDKQLGDIGKKFGSSFKDIFLGFAAPMVLLQGAIQMITSAIAKAKQDAKDGLDLVARGETVFATSEEKRLAAYFKAKKAREEEQKLAVIGVAESFREFVRTTPEGEKMVQDYAFENAGNQKGILARSGNFEELGKIDPAFMAMMMAAFNNSPEGKKAKDEAAASEAAANEAAKKAGSFKGPEGFGTVVGVGANPVMEKMTRQNELLEQIRMILEETSAATRSGSVPAPFTEAVPLTLQKSGLV
jgi:hypothetical protein